MRIGILGSGLMGGKLGTLFARAGHDVVFSYARQRRMFFPDRSPLHTYLPANLQHCGVLLWDLTVMGRGGPEFGRLTGTAYALAYLWLSTKRELLRKDARWRVPFARVPREA